MFRILLVEDTANVREELCGLFHEVFLESLVENAWIIEDGLHKIKTAADSRQPYDVAILDFTLPLRQGENPEIDGTLCQTIKQVMPDTLVIHITAFHKDPMVTQHVAEHHSGRNTPRSEVVHKTTGWSDQLLKEMKSYLYNTHIERQLDGLFGKSTSSKYPQIARGSLTQAIAKLSREIGTYWAHLDEGTKLRIQNHFRITESANEVRAHLIRPG